jgi:hypothetical protein
MTQQRKAKRRLSDFDFSKEGSHIALVHKDQGGAANGYETLIMKSTANFSQEFIQKAQRVKVEMELPEFLMRFYGMWYEDDAKELAKLFGWVDYSDVADKVEDAIEGERSVELVDSNPTDYVKTKLQDLDNLVSVAKASTKEGKIDTALLANTLASLTEEQYLMLLEDQASVEKALKSGGKKPNKKVVDKEQPIVKKADKAVHKEEKQMTDKVAEQEVDVVAKAQYDEIQKAFKEQEEQLQKATAMLEEFKQKEKEQIQKAREATILAAVEAKDTAEKLFKAVGELEQEQFDVVVEVVKSLVQKASDTDMFKEIGSQQEGEQVHKSTVQKILAQKYAN